MAASMEEEWRDFEEPPHEIGHHSYEDSMGVLKTRRVRDNS